MDNPFYSASQNSLESSEQALLHSASFNDPRMTALIRMLAQSMNGGRQFSPGMETGLRHLLVGARSSFGVSDPSDMLASIYSGLISRGGTLLSSGGASIGGAYGRGYTQMGLAQQYMNSWMNYSSNAYGGQSYAATAGLSYKQQGDIMAQLLRERGPGAARSIYMGNGSAQGVQAGYAELKAYGGMTKGEEASSQRIVKLLAAAEAKLKKRGLNASDANYASEKFNTIAEVGESMGMRAGEIQTTQSLGAGALKMDTISRKQKEEMSKAIKNTTHVVRELSNVFQESDFNKLQESVKELGLGSITASSNVKKMNDFLRTARTMAAVSGKRVEDIVAEQVDIARGFGGIFGRKMSHGEIVAVQQAGLQEGGPYDKTQRMSFAARNEAAASNLAKYTAAGMRTLKNLKEVGGSDQELETLVEASRNAKDPQEQQLYDHKVRALLATKYQAALRPAQMQMAQEEYGNAAASNIRRHYFTQNRQTELKRLGLTGMPGSQEAMELTGYFGTDAKLYDKYVGYKRGTVSEAELFSSVKELGHDAYDLTSSGFSALLAKADPRAVAAMREVAQDPRTQGIINDSAHVNKQAAIDAMKKANGWDEEAKRTSGGIVENFLAGLVSADKDVTQEQLLMASLQANATTGGISVDEAAKQAHAKLAAVGHKSYALGEVEEGRFKNIEELAANSEFLKSVNLTAAQLRELNRKGGAVSYVSTANSDMTMFADGSRAHLVDKAGRDVITEDARKSMSEMDILRGMPLGNMIAYKDKEGVRRFRPKNKPNQKGILLDDLVSEMLAKDPEVRDMFMAKHFEEGSTGQAMQKKYINDERKLAYKALGLAQIGEDQKDVEHLQKEAQKRGFKNISEWTEQFNEIGRLTEAGRIEEAADLMKKYGFDFAHDEATNKLIVSDSFGTVRTFTPTNERYNNSKALRNANGKDYGWSKKNIESTPVNTEELERHVAQIRGNVRTINREEEEAAKVEEEKASKKNQENLNKSLEPLHKELKSIAESLQRQGPGVPVVLVQNNS